ncbi:hypothetical protein BDW60DRAFT_48097 [Aspergillus nidulans var. acristatus]
MVSLSLWLTLGRRDTGKISAGLLLGLRFHGREINPVPYTTAMAKFGGNDRPRRSNNRITRGTWGKQSTSWHMKGVMCWNGTEKSWD